MIGTNLAHYRVTAALGAGGMGEVWRAEDEKLGREVALKLLPADFADDPDRHARFEREARVLASLNHPNIATLYGLEHVHVPSSVIPRHRSLADARDKLRDEGSGRGESEASDSPAQIPRPSAFGMTDSLRGEDLAAGAPLRVRCHRGG